jgi:predicted nucleic acid-binding protein
LICAPKVPVGFLGNASGRFDSVNAGSLHISAITILELEIGILQLERKDQRQGAILRIWLDTLV